MIRLSVNVNKVATLRNSRGGTEPRVLDAVQVCLDAGVHGITVHPRADQRHITPTDVRDIARALENRRPAVEYNMEGDPRPDFLELVYEVRPDQCTLVPVIPGEITSQAGWSRIPDAADVLPPVIRALQSRGTRVSLFVDPLPEAITLAHQVGADRIELYTEPFARAFEQGAIAVRSPGAGQDYSESLEARQSFAAYADAAERAHALGLGVNAGHDLDLQNLVLFRTLPHLDEVSIGHAIMSRALFVGLRSVVGEYLEILSTHSYPGSLDPGL